MQVFIRLLAILTILLSSLQTAMPQALLASTSAPNNPYVRINDDEESGKPNTPTRRVNAFIAAETKVRETLNQYTFKRDVVLQTIDPAGEVTGEYIRNSQFLFDDKGNRIERVLYRPKSTLRGMRITKEDIQDLEGAQLLGIDVTESEKYRLEYAGEDNNETRDSFVINVTPIQTPNPQQMRERFFVGRIWVDSTTFQLLRVQGRVEPQGKQRFPLFETRRELAGDQLYFPTLTEADDILRFPKYDVHYRVKVRYYDYKRFASKLTLTELEPSPEVNP